MHKKYTQKVQNTGLSAVSEVELIWLYVFFWTETIKIYPADEISVAGSRDEKRGRSMKRKRKWHRVISLLLAAVMVLSLMQVRGWTGTVYAGEIEQAEEQPDTGNTGDDVILEASATETYVPDASGLPDSDELFAGYAMQVFYGDSGVALLSNFGEAELDGYNLILYRALKEGVADLAAEGGEAQVVVNLGDDAIPVESSEGGNIQDAMSQAFAASGIDLNTIMSCLLADCPYELYWYDKTHFRNSIGESMVAVITGDESIYIPEGFGRYVTADMPADSGYFAQDCSVPAENYTASVPVLMYHHLNDSGEGSSTIQTETFRAHMEAIKDAGYQTVSLEEIYNYVWYGTPLPENPIAITFDDGYTSNYELAYPILKELDMQAAIFAIGVSVGKDTYKDTNYEMTPHFSWEQANEMISSGLITVQTHTYDFHQWPPYEAEGSAARENVLPLAGETEEHYMEAFGADLSRARQELEQETGQNCYVLAYPEGASTTLSAVVAAQSGIRMTFSTTAETSTLVKGLPQSLLNIPRYGIDDMTADELLRLLDGETAS